MADFSDARTIAILGPNFLSYEGFEVLVATIVLVL